MDINSTDQTIILGQKVKLTATVFGIPKPEVQWYKDSIELHKAELLSTETLGQYETVLEHEVSDETDAGKYQLVASNIHGTETVEFNVVVKSNAVFVHVTP